jgi:small subunit ribosomal protein S16
LAVKIRLMRVGKKKQPTYRIVVADGRKPRDGRFIEILGQYAPREEPSIVNLNNERALHWLNNGAQPTETAAKLLEVAGVWDEYKAAAGKVAAAKPKVKVKAKAVKEAPPAPEAPTASAPEPAAPAAEAPAEEAPAEETVADEAPAAEEAAAEVPAEEA